MTYKKPDSPKICEVTQRLVSLGVAVRLAEYEDRLVREVTALGSGAVINVVERRFEVERPDNKRGYLDSLGEQAREASGNENVSHSRAQWFVLPEQKKKSPTHVQIVPTFEDGSDVTVVDLLEANQFSVYLGEPGDFQILADFHETARPYLTQGKTQALASAKRCATELKVAFDLELDDHYGLMED